MGKGTNKAARPSYKIALAGNPNVGKSTIFNTLTGLRRHTGNWSGKTVDSAVAKVSGEGRDYYFADIPGTYSLATNSEEERIATDCICFYGADCTVIVADGTALTKSMPLIMQIREVSRRCVLCLNFEKQSRRRGIETDKEKLSEMLGMPVIGVDGKSKKSVKEITDTLDRMDFEGYRISSPIEYHEDITSAVKMVEREVMGYYSGGVPTFWLSLKLLEEDNFLTDKILSLFSGEDGRARVQNALSEALNFLFERGIDKDKFKELEVNSIVLAGERAARECCVSSGGKDRLTERLDKFFVGKYTAYPVMILLLGVVLWITLSLANYPSAMLSRIFGSLQIRIYDALCSLNMSGMMVDGLVYGVLGTLFSVVSVMLPPMAIFFPLFTLLEDFGYLPRVAYNLDRPFARCGACGKMGLTMCMGLGCNAVGVCGARIIDSDREKKIAVLTNSLMPCNGRLPMLSTLITLFLFFTGAKEGGTGMGVALILSAMIILSIVFTFLVSKLLSSTVLKGESSSFTLELPSFRVPNVPGVIINSLTHRVFALLMRAMAISAPMGLVIFLLANISAGDSTLIGEAVEFLDPIAAVFGFDGVMLLSFILGMPANEIVLPVAMMVYTGGGAIGEEIGTLGMYEIFSNHGWSSVQYITAAVFALFHFPCSTTLITVYKETKSFMMTFLSFIIPTALGLLLCALINLAFTVFS